MSHANAELTPAGCRRAGVRWLRGRGVGRVCGWGVGLVIL